MEGQRRQRQGRISHRSLCEPAQRTDRQAQSESRKPEADVCTDRERTKNRRDETDARRQAVRGDTGGRARIRCAGGNSRTRGGLAETAIQVTERIWTQTLFISTANSCPLRKRASRCSPAHLSSPMALLQ